MLERLPRGCLGEFDFVSGLLYVDCHIAEHNALVEKRQNLGNRWDTKLSAREKLLVETGMHEYFHYLQVLSSGYLLETVLALLDTLQATANRFRQDGRDEVRLACFGRLAERILRPIHSVNATSGLSPVDLIEGAAYYFQSRSLGRAADHDEMLKALELPGLEPEYSRAYHHATAKLHDSAFDQFLLCVGTALLFADPPAAFDHLLDRLAIDLASRKRVAFERVVMAVSEQHLYIGSAVDVRRLRKKDDMFPWYGDPLSRVARSHGLPPAFFHAADDAVFRKLQPARVFRDNFIGDLGIQAMFALVASRSIASLRFTLPYTGVGESAAPS